MSSYEYTDSTGDKLRINSNGYGGATLIAEGNRGLARKTVLIEHTDAPTVAAELLQAAGHDNLADLVGWESAEKKLQERRDAVTREIMRNDDGLVVSDYASLNWYTKKAVDRIIELATILETPQS